MIGAIMALAQVIGQPEVRKEGEEYDFECPKCTSDGKKKLGVNVRKLVFHCFRCKWKGSMIDLFDALGIDYSVDTKPSPLVEPEGMPGREPPRRIPGFNPINLYASSEIESRALLYCRERGDLSAAQVVERGWGTSVDDHLFGRLIVPVYLNGRVVQYVARSLYTWLKPKEKSGSKAAGWWPKSEVALGMEDYKRGSEIVVVEGLWDREAVHRAGRRCVALLGSAASEFVVGRLLAKVPKRIVLALDNDQAGLRGTRQLIRTLGRRAPDLEVRVIDWKPGETDPDALVRTVNASTLKHRLRNSILASEWTSPAWLRA